MRRLQKEAILKDLEKKIVFIIGPRQVGKTWLAKDIGKNFKNTVYLNYDSMSDRKIMKDESWLESTDLLILDELHKMPGWKNYLKGVFDTGYENMRILVTGSARLDTFRQTGDSLAGRFFVHRLLPFSLSELRQTEFEDDLERLIDRGGFPEPFLADLDIEADRWRMQYIDGLIRSDILDFEKIYDFKAIRTVFDLLREKVGSPISYKSIAEDAGISPTTARKYIQIFEALFIVFRVSPFSKNIARSLLKEPKIYFFDTGLVNGDRGVRFENLVAVSLLKDAYGKTDSLGLKHNLSYLRTKEGREVDFCLTKEGQIEYIAEVKYADNDISKSLKYYTDKYSLKGVQIVKELKQERKEGLIDIRKGTLFLKELDY